MDVLEIAAIAVPAVLAVTVHEVAHGWMARLCGDPTAEQAGRLSLNPLRHVDPVGTVLLPVVLKLMGAPFLFGWAKPVPVNWQRLRRLRLGLALVAAAGPLSNLLMMFAWLLGFLAVPHIPLLEAMCWTGVVFNATICVLNLIPIPPLDGSRIVSAILPGRIAVLYNRLEPFGMVLAALLLATGAFGALMTPTLHWVQQLARLLA